MKPFETATALCLVALAAAPAAHGAVAELDANANAGVYSVPGGTWDFGNTVLWTDDGGATRRAWTSNADTMRITLPGSSAWGDVTLTGDSSLGALGTAGIEIAGFLKDWQHVSFKGDGFSLGDGGLVNANTNQNSYMYFQSPVTLSAAQTWRSANARDVTSFGTVVVESPLTASSAETTLSFDGDGRNDPGVKTGAARVGFSLKADNTLLGSTTVSNGAQLSLVYSAAAPGDKICATAPLVLQGGGLWMTGKPSPAPTQTVSRVILRSGCNFITSKDGSGAFRMNGIERDGVGGTFDFTISWVGGVTCLVNAQNENGILGGWATIALGPNKSGQFVSVNADGTLNGVSGTQRTVETMTNGLNAQLRNAATRTSGDVAPNSLTLRADGEVNFGTATVMVQSGGILSIVSATNTLAGGTLKTGMATGELFVHAVVPTVISSPLADNGDIPGILVKNGLETLRLTGDFGFTGATYLNSGILDIAGSAVLSNAVVQAGGTTLRVSDGGTLAPASPLTLGGNLELGDGGRVALPLQATAPVTLANRWATLSGPEEGGEVVLSLAFPEGAAPQRGTYPLVSLADGAAVSGLSAESFSVSLPTGIAGTVSVTESGVSFTVTSVPSGGIVVVFR